MGITWNNRFLFGFSNGVLREFIGIFCKSIRFAHSRELIGFLSHHKRKRGTEVGGAGHGVEKHEGA